MTHYSRGRPFLTMFDEIFERESYRFSMPGPGGRILDIGANIGLATIYFKRLHPRASVVAVEANPDIGALLKRNVASHGLSDVTVLTKAVASEAGKVRFHCEPGLGSRLADGAGDATIEVEAVTLASLVTDDVQLVKLDVEGAESPLLQANNDWLNQVPRLFFEHHLREDEGDSLPGILLDLSRRGFRHLTAPATEIPPRFEGPHAFPPFVRQQNVWAWKPR